MLPDVVAQKVYTEIMKTAQYQYLRNIFSNSGIDEERRNEMREFYSSLIKQISSIAAIKAIKNIKGDME